MEESGKSMSELKRLTLGDEKAVKTKQKKMPKEDRFEEGLGRSEKPGPSMTSDVEKLEWLSAPESSPISRVPSTVEMPCLDKDDRKIEKTKQEKSSDKDPEGYKEAEKPMPCRSSDGFYAEWLSASESSLYPGATVNVEMRYMHKTDEKEDKYLEIIDDVMIQKEILSDVDTNESAAEQPMSFALVKFEAERFPAQKGTSGSAVTKNTSIEMTYLHKKDEEKVDKYRYMTLDEDRKRREDLGRYKSLSVPCMSSVNARESSSSSRASPAAENLLNTHEYDEVMTENKNSSPGGYEEPGVVNSERPPVPGRSHSRRVTSTRGETSVYEELQ